MSFKTEQEEFWSGEFGDLYVDRNNSEELLASNIYFFSKILSQTKNVNSVVEFGANIGLNLKACKTLLPSLKCAAIEINHKAATILHEDPFWNGEIKVLEQSILEYKADDAYDLALIKGVLIHINPDELPQVYQKLYDSAKKYICIAEYYNPSPVSISYRGEENKLFKRDFAGEFMKQFPDVSLVDYGFAWHGDNNFKQDDITWFLLKK